jgi:hypothetical protein
MSMLDQPSILAIWSDKIRSENRCSVAGSCYDKDQSPALWGNRMFRHRLLTALIAITLFAGCTGMDSGQPAKPMREFTLVCGKCGKTSRVKVAQDASSVRCPECGHKNAAD